MGPVTASPKVPDMLLVRVPANPVVATTLTVTVQLPKTLLLLADAGTVAPDSVMLPAPAGADTATPAPVHVVLAPGTAATTMPAGKVSVRLTPVNADSLRFCSVRVSVEVATPLARMEVGAKVLSRTPPVCIDSVPLLMGAALLEPSALVTPAAAMVLMTVLFCAAWGVAGATLNVTVQNPCPAMVAPARLAEPAPAGAVTVPPQVVVAPGVV